MPLEMIMNSILDTIKKMLGLDPESNAFDTDIIVTINSVLMALRQMGVGPKEGLTITGSQESWNDLLGNDNKQEAVKTYIYLRVKSVFDPTASSVVNEAYKSMIGEIEWRLTSENDYGGSGDE